MAEGESIRILIADDHAIVREGLRALIGTEPGMELVGEASDGVEAVRMARALKPDVILLDLVMPRMDGLEAIAAITQDDPEARILVLTSFAEDEKVFPAIKAGALGYLLKDTSPRELLRAITDVYRGESSLHPTIARRVIGALSRPPSPPPAGQELTNQEIADRLIIGERTVRKHVSNILGKLHLANRTQATLYALRTGLASSEAE